MTDSRRGSSYQEVLAAKIDAREARCVVIGVGYVGLPLLVELARAGFPAFGYEVDAKRIAAIENGTTSVHGASPSDVADLVKAGKIVLDSRSSVLSDADVVLISVPTPLREDGTPDMQAVDAAVDDLVGHAHAGMLVVLESTSYPGTTREMASKLSAAGFSIGEEMFVACSPERIDPGNTAFGLRNTPRVVGGVSPSGTRMAIRLYETIVDNVTPVSDSNAAEVVKLLENTFRAVNIGLVNELAVASRKLGVDIWEVIDAAATKPFGFMKFSPGPGVGGPCVPVAARTLSWKMSQFGVVPDFLELATRANERMPAHVALLLEEALAKRDAPRLGAKVLLLGMAYKTGIGDLRGSPGLALLELLEAKQLHVSYMDPYVPALTYKKRFLVSLPLEASLAEFDAVVVLTPHPEIDMKRVVTEARFVLDTRNATAPHLASATATVVRL